jgi:predicted  nucleic acid-binding Zn-ribbon protein
MSLLATFKELQATIDNLSTIERDLSAFPPDLAALDQELKILSRQLAETEKSVIDWKNKRESSLKEHCEAQRLEDLARKALKLATQKVQYAAAIREVDERERQKAGAARPMKESEAKCIELEARLASLQARNSEADARFKELHQIFLAEHENQVLAKQELTTKRVKLESSLPQVEQTRFQRLILNRQGRAVVPVENSTCMGCRVKLRMIFMSDLRQKDGIMLCESCQRIVYLP